MAGKEAKHHERHSAMADSLEFNILEYYQASNAVKGREQVDDS